MMLYRPRLLRILQSLLVRHLPCWGLTADCRVALLTVSENATFVVTDAAGRRRILRLYRPACHNDDEILSELRWMQALEQTDIVRIPHVYPTVQGNLLVICEAAGLRWRIACFEYLSGVMPDADAMLPARFRKLGAITARLHAHSRAWQKPAGFCRKHWTYATMAGPQAYWGDWRKVRNLRPAARILLERCCHLLRARTARPVRQDGDYILLHADLRPANLLADGDRLAAIDFDDCGYSWTALDFANSVSFMEDHPLVPELREAWLSGYAAVTPPSHMLTASIDLFIMLRRMQLTAWLATHAETSTARDLGENFVSGTLALAETFLTTAQQAPLP